MILKSFSKAAACLLLVLAFANAAQAQFRRAIEGTVTDPSGGIVSEAQVTLVNVETGEPKVNANGQRGDGNSYYVDGISANSNPDPGTVYVTLNPDLDPRSVASSLTDGNISKATEVFYPRTVQLGARIEF